MKTKETTVRQFKKAMIIILIFLFILFIIVQCSVDSEETQKLSALNTTSQQIMDSTAQETKINEIATRLSDANITTPQLKECMKYSIYTKSRDYTMAQMKSHCIGVREINPKMKYPNIAKAIDKAIGIGYGGDAELQVFIGRMMNDPDSFEWISTSTRIIDNEKPYIEIKTEFKGTNIYGGIVRNIAYSKLDINSLQYYDIKID